MKIVDISHHNTIFDYDSFLKDCDGVIIRMGYRGYGSTGKIVYDKKWKENVEKVISSGKAWGVYFFPQSITNEEAVEEAYFIIDELKKYDVKNMTLGIWLDSEFASPRKDGRGDKLSKKDRTARLVDIIYILQAYFVNVGVYASDTWFKDFLDIKLLKPCKLWVARYYNNNGVKPSKVPQIVTDWDIWQYTSKGKVAGVKGFVDLNCLNDEPEENKDLYYPKYTSDSGSIVVGLKYIGVDSSYKFRKQIAIKNNIGNYSGTAEQNIKLLSLLKNGKLKRV